MSAVRSILTLFWFPLSAFTHHPTADYKRIDVQGHPVYLSPEAVSAGTLLDRVVAKLDSDLAMIQSRLPAEAVTKIAGLAFWIEHDNPDVPGMTYHPSGGWLKAHGYNTDKTRCVEIGNLENFLSWHREQPFFVLHEMSHAYHNQVLGDDNPVILRAFRLAVAGHKYESVRYMNGDMKKAYALTNAAEYFAELSEAYWGKNDFYPFVRSELREFDAIGFETVENLWLYPGSRLLTPP